MRRNISMSPSTWDMIKLGARRRGQTVSRYLRDAAITALHRDQIEIVRPPCLHCGDALPMHMTRTTAVYCSDRCRAAAFRARRGHVG